MNELKAQERANVIITKLLASQVAVLHNKCPSKTEWSGILIYEVIEGDLTELKGLVIKAHAVFPMNFGNGTYTEYESSPEVLKVFEIYPEVDPIKKDPKWFIGHIHSHHDMTTFFSGTDTSELLTNVKNLPIYLSLIVNYACSPCAKIAVVAEAEEVTVKIVRWKIPGFTRGGKDKANTVVKHTPAYVIDCDISMEVDDWFLTRLTEVQAIKVPIPISTGVVHVHNNHKGKKNKYDFPFHTNDTKGKARPEVYGRALATLADLLSLGVRGGSPYNVLMFANKEVVPMDTGRYKNALKMYFLDTWYDATFVKGSVTPLEALDSITDFIAFHNTVWIAPTVKEMVNELKDELTVLH